MYSVVGADGQVYGPVDVVTLKEWAGQGRLNAKTNLIDPLDGRVMSADVVPELRSLFFVAPPIIPQPFMPSPQPMEYATGDPPVSAPTYTNPSFPPAPTAPVYTPMSTSPVQQAAAIQQGVPGAPSVQVNNYIALNNQTAVVTVAPGTRNKTTAILLCLFLGGLGVHRYYLGRNGSATAMLLITVLSAGYLGVFSGIWALVDLVRICTGSMMDVNDHALI